MALVTHDIQAFGGMEQACTELIRRGSKTVDFVVVSATLREDLRQLVRWYRVPVPRRPAPLKFALFYLLAGLQILRTRADLVHTVGAIVPNYCDLVWVQHCHAGVRQRTGRYSPPGMPHLRRLNTAVLRLLSLAAERWSYRVRRTRFLVVASSAVEQEVRRHFPDVPVAIIPNGVDTKRFAVDSRARARLRDAQKIGNEVVALFVGGDWYRKGLPLVIEALSEAQRDSFVNITLWVVGRGDQPAFRQLAKTFGVAEFVRFFGCAPEVTSFYSAADMFVLPSSYEGFSLVALEAASSGLPLITTRAGIMEELVGQDAGVLVDPQPQAIADAMRRLAQDAGLRRQLGQAGRRRAQRFSWDRSVRDLVERYGELRESRFEPPAWTSMRALLEMKRPDGHRNPGRPPLLRRGH